MAGHWLTDLIDVNFYLHTVLRVFSVLTDKQTEKETQLDKTGVLKKVCYGDNPLFKSSSATVRRTWRTVGGMSGRGKPTAAVKVSPPTVPDSAGGVTHRHSGSSFSSGVYSAGDQRSSYSSSVSDDNPPPSPRSPARGTYHTIIPGTYHIT
ncbi:hypothetical protein Hamer_G016836, partial [Homarus americanus]